MSKARLDVINQAYNKLDKTGDGLVTLDDLRLLYSVDQHPKYRSGEMTKDQILKQFMDTFQEGGVLDDQVGIVAMSWLFASWPRGQWTAGRADDQRPGAAKIHGLVSTRRRNGQPGDR